MDTYLNANIVFSKFTRDYMALKKDLPIRPSEMGVLNILTKREGDYTSLAIAELLGVSKSMIAAHIQVLLKKGYIYKEASLGDKRSFYVRPTEKARELSDEFEEKQTKYLKTIEAKLGASDFAELIRLLDKTQTILDKI
ncbi:MAG: MarR family transcriptional regulator [Clostridia bacterium]|nr:MarR family transcriptional regulator [Clostridia bacterium]